MAKSLRSKPKLRAKSIKRKGEFTKFVDERNERLAQKAKENLVKQKEAMVTNTPASEPAQEIPDKKISTSGWRGTSRQRLKARKAKARGKRI